MPQHVPAPRRPSVITCRKCAKENQDHYKFCLGCGAELPREAGPKPFSPQTPPHGVNAVAPAAAQPSPAVHAAPAASPKSAMAATALVGSVPPAAAPAGHAQQVRPSAATQSAPPAAADANVNCPQCSHVNPRSNRFCAACGYNLTAAAQMIPSAPPMAQAPATAPIRPVVMVALRADGSEAGSYPLPDSAQLTLGRDTGSIFAGDSYLSPRHA